MAEASGAEIGGAPKTPDRTKPLESRDSREQVFNAFNSSFSLLEQTPEDQLSQEEIWVKKSITDAREKTTAQGKGTFTNTFENHHTGEAFSQEEGIPIEGLLEFMEKKLEALPPDSPDRQNIINWGHTLYRNSEAFYRLPHRMDPEILEARRHQEAQFISQDSRKTGSETDDWYKAVDTLNKRHELVLPADDRIQAVNDASADYAIEPEPQAVNTEQPKTGAAAEQIQSEAPASEVPASQSVPSESRGSGARYIDTATQIKREELGNSPSVTKMREVISTIKGDDSSWNDINNLPLIADQLREVGVWNNPDKAKDPSYQALKSAMEKSGLPADEALLATEYLLDEAKRADNTTNEAARKDSEGLRRSVLDTVEHTIDGLVTFSPGAEEMNMVKEDRNTGYQDIRAAQIVSDFLLDTYNPEARSRWGNDKIDSKTRIAERQAYNTFLLQILQGNVPEDQQELADKLRLKIAELSTLSPNDAFEQYKGLDTNTETAEGKKKDTDADRTKRSVQTWRDKGVEPYDRGSLDLMAVKGLLLLERRGIVPQRYETTEIFYKKALKEKRGTIPVSEAVIEKEITPTTASVEKTITAPPEEKTQPTIEEIAAGELEPEKTAPEPTPQPATVEKISREFNFVNRTQDIEKRSREMAETQLRAEMRRGGMLNPLNWARKTRLGVAEEYYRQIFTERARQAMLANNNSFLEMDVVRNAAIDANANLQTERESGRATIERTRESGAGVGEQTIEAQGELKTLLMEQIISPAVNRQITDVGRVQETLRQFVINNIDNPQVSQDVRDQLQSIFGRDTSQFGRLAEYFATDLLEVAGAVRSDIEAGKYTNEQLDSIVRINLANTRWAAETQATFSAADRAIRWAESRRLTGWLVNPATIGAAAALGIYGGMRVAGVGARATALVPGVGVLPGALFAAYRRNYDLKVDMASHKIDMAYNIGVPEAGERREALERYSYNTASIDQLLNGGGAELITGGDRESFATLLGGDMSDVNVRAAVLRRVAEIQTRLDFSSRERVDLVTFESRTQVEQGRLALTRAIAQARISLRNSGLTDQQAEEALGGFRGQWQARFTENTAQQDREFAGYRTRQAIAAGTFATAAGLGLGFVGEEILEHTGAGDFLIEHISNLNPFHHEVPTAPTPGAENITPRPTFTDASVGHDTKIPQGTHWTVNSDHPGNFNLVDADGRSVATNAHFDTSGHMTNESTIAGVTINQTPVETTVNHDVFGDNGEWTKNTTGIDRTEWYAHNTPSSEGNELRLDTFQHGNTVTLDASSMHEAWQTGAHPQSIDVQEVIKNGELKFKFEIPGRDSIIASADTDGTLTLNPDAAPGVPLDLSNPNSIDIANFSKTVLNQGALADGTAGNATELNNHLDVFNLGADGKPGFISAGRLIDVNGEKVWQSFATIRGTGTPPTQLTETITKFIPEISMPHAVIPPVASPSDFNMPIIPIPFAPRYPLEAMNQGEKTTASQSAPSPAETEGKEKATIDIEDQKARAEMALEQARKDKEEILANTTLSEEEKNKKLEELDANIQGLESLSNSNEIRTLSEEPHKLGEVFGRIQGDIPKDNNYYIENPPETLNLTKEDLTSLEQTEPFFVNINGDENGIGWETNKNVVPFVWTNAGNLRFTDAENQTNGDSGTLALAAISSGTPQKQAGVYRIISGTVLDVHQNNPDLLLRWWHSQATSPGAINGNTFNSASIFILNDFNQKTNTLRPINERLYAFEQPMSSEQIFQTEWTKRISELREAVTQDTLQPHHLRWIEFLSHSVNLPKLIEKTKGTEAASSGKTTKIPKRVNATTNSSIPDQTVEKRQSELMDINSKLAEFEERGGKKGEKLTELEDLESREEINRQVIQEQTGLYYRIDDIVDPEAVIENKIRDSVNKKNAGKPLDKQDLDNLDLERRRAQIRRLQQLRTERGNLSRRKKELNPSEEEETELRGIRPAEISQTPKVEVNEQTATAIPAAENLDPKDRWDVDSLEPGGTTFIKDAPQIKDIVDGQECETLSGRKGIVVGHVLLEDGTPALRIKIIGGQTEKIWSEFTQEDLQNGKISKWLPKSQNPV